MDSFFLGGLHGRPILISISLASHGCLCESLGRHTATRTLLCWQIAHIQCGLQPVLALPTLLCEQRPCKPCHCLVQNESVSTIYLLVSQGARLAARSELLR